jgi:translation elongation factor EF-Ts
VIEFNVQGGADPAAIQTHLSEGLGKKLAMHIVAAKPLYLDTNQIPQDFIDKEIEIFR